MKNYKEIINKKRLEREAKRKESKARTAEFQIKL